MPSTSLDPVLITGCSSGIGRASADLLVKAGHTVYATARRTETLAQLEAAGARVLALDVTSEDSMAAAVEHIEAEHGRVGTLVNNAGYGEYGTIEEADLDRVRTMFETNVFGLARLTQLVLPGMRRAHRGRIINIG
jgi:NADP-dependent 3-hydroxy acid dehydrogenase YdfG